MRIIIDTHIFLWALSDPKRIDKDKLAEIETQANIVYVSSISIAEIMIKTSLGKLDLAFNPVEMVEKCGFESLEFRGEDALLLRDLPFHHRDPFDRMLIAQSLVNQYPILTNDREFQAYDCKLM
ncbi:MAG: type II toxin-antitoxin system VapC family toxin [bacterium]|nr:type II toxin-antitoxin system VapC family toxin [bacterium]